MLALAAQVVKWSALGEEAIVALIGGVGVVSAFGIMLVGLDNRARARRTGAATVTANAMVVGGALVCLAALVVGFIAMTHKS
ncbi:MAG: hypothetical protein JO156_06660 [Solirubrobacterales bacterium]|nr:hypothetical protein [Solirubrobacterales bacterium]